MRLSEFGISAAIALFRTRAADWLLQRGTARAGRRIGASGDGHVVMTRRQSCTIAVAETQGDEGRGGRRIDNFAIYRRKFAFLAPSTRRRRDCSRFRRYVWAAVPRPARSTAVLAQPRLDQRGRHSLFDPFMHFGRPYSWSVPSTCSTPSSKLEATGRYASRTDRRDACARRGRCSSPRSAATIRATSTSEKVFHAGRTAASTRWLQKRSNRVSRGPYKLALNNESSRRHLRRPPQRRVRVGRLRRAPTLRRIDSARRRGSATGSDPSAGDGSIDDVQRVYEAYRSITDFPACCGARRAIRRAGG